MFESDLFYEGYTGLGYSLDQYGCCDDATSPNIKLSSSGVMPVWKKNGGSSEEGWVPGWYRGMASGISTSWLRNEESGEL